MSKKLKIYTSLLICFIVMTFVYSISSVCHYDSGTNITSYRSEGECLENVKEPSSFATHTRDKNGTLHSQYKPTKQYSVFVRPKAIVNDSVMMSHSFGQDYKVTMEKVKLEVPYDSTKQAIIFIAPYLTIGFFIAAICFYIVWISIKIIRNVRTGNVFVADIAKKLETLGIMLVGLYFADLITSYAIAQYNIHHVFMADYDIVFCNTSNIMYIISGLAFMVVSQVILMGKELKDEQDLTV